ncbi:MAG: SRPBCC family protein [Trueperaceae bacterium]
MVEILSRGVVPAPADVVWSELRTFAGGERFSDQIDRMTVEGAGVGATREVVFSSGDHVVERLDAVDDASRTLAYSMVSGSLPFEDFRSRVRVVPNDEGSCTVEWAATFDAPPEQVDALQDLVQGLYDEVLANLATMGSTPAT